MNWKKYRQNLERRRRRIRSRIFGTPERPRLHVHKSNRYLYAQIVDDTTGRTLLSMTTRTPEAGAAGKSVKNLEAARRLGERIAAAALERGITSVVFDRGVWVYHGRIKAVAEGARAQGLKF